MVKTAIIGADTAQAGELLRILINHPETDIISLYAPNFSGRSVSSHHYGLIGESIVNFTDRIEPSELDLVFLADESPISRSMVENRERWPELRIIDMFGKSASDIYYGLSEINRKQIVREARHVYLPTTPAALALVALNPLARYLLLNSDLDLEFTMPTDQIAEYKDFEGVRREISTQLHGMQSSFDYRVNISLLKAPEGSRVIGLRTEIECPLPIDEVAKIYEGIYDDHNFTFVTLNPVSWKEVEGSHKIVISLNKPTSGKLEIQAVADSRLRGGAGDAVHMLNLLFGLHEKTGLHLKSSGYGIPDARESASSSWFA